MKVNRSVLLVGLGVLAGSALTALLFYFLNRPPQMEETDSDVTTEEKETDSIKELETVENLTFNRDISGNGTLSGVVRNPEGAFIESALIKIHLTDQPWSHPDPPMATETDSKGNFVIEGLSEDMSYQVWALAPGTASAAKKTVRCGLPVEFVLEEGASVELTFLGLPKDSGAEVEVQLAGTDLWPIRQIRVPGASPLTIEGLREGEYVLWVQSGDLAYISPQPIQLKKGDDVDLKIDLQKALSAKVNILDEAGQLLTEKTTITVTPISSGLLSRTLNIEKTGTATIGGLIPGAYTVVASAQGYVQSPPYQLRLEDEIRIPLERGATVSGFVRTESGDPVGGASVALDQELGSAVVSLPQGSGRQFRIRLQEAAVSGWPRMYSIEEGVIAPGPSRMPLPFVTAETISGLGRAWRPSDPNGRFLLDGLPSGRLSAWATHPDYVAAKKVDITLEPGGRARDVMIVMQAGSTLNVRTTDERGFPLPDSEVGIYGKSGELLASTQTESDGYATLKGLPGSFRIEATSEGRVPTVKKVEGKAGRVMELMLKMPPADKTLYGRVTNGDGFGIGNALVTARSSGRGQAHVLTGISAEDGTFSLEGAGSQRYHVTAQDEEKGEARYGDAISGENIILVLNQNSGHQGDALDVIQPGADFGQQDSLGQGFQIENAETVETEFGQADQLPVTGPPPGKGGLPIKIGGSPGRVVVKSVALGSQVAEAGLSKGDRIIAIDGKKVTGPSAARKAISGKIGTVVLLKVDGKDGLYTVVVQRVRVAAN